MKNVDYQQKRYAERREEIIALLGGQCVKCGSIEDLEIDHIDPSKKSFDISDHMKASLEILMPEVLKCQILCRSHHAEKTLREMTPWSHGTLHGYQHKQCRCEKCVERGSQEAQRKRLSRGGSIYPRSEKPHGTYAKYKSGCRCLECKTANADYMQMLRDRKSGSEV